MRFLTCGADSILVELADLDETLRVFAALQSAVKHAMEQTAESPERAAQPSATSAFAGVKQLIPAARTVYVAFDPLLSSRVELTAAIRALNVAADMERHSTPHMSCRQNPALFPLFSVLLFLPCFFRYVDKICRFQNGCCRVENDAFGSFHQVR